MSKLNIDQKPILALFSDKKSNFLIPDYQRPYAWGIDECRTLWDDFVGFAFPNSNKNDFKGDEYFLGPIVTFKNDDGQLEVIDGQQRLTTLLLLLRALYPRFLHINEDYYIDRRKEIEKCIWKTNELGQPDMNALKIDSEVATDDAKEEFLSILRTGEVKDGQKSAYAQNFRFFQTQIADWVEKFAPYLPYFAIRLLNNCILLPIEAESQDTALRIFSTLNDRGKPLADADIFKAQFYKYYSLKGEKNKFIKRWKALEEVCNSTFKSPATTPMDEIFARYMYYLRAKDEIKETTTEGLRRFYEKDGYVRLKNDQALNDLEDLAFFWKDVAVQSEDRFSISILKKLFVLNYAPNGMWYNLVSVYYLSHRDAKGQLPEQDFDKLLSRIIGFVWAYALTNPGVNALRKPFYAEMINAIKGVEVTFSAYPFDESQYRSMYLAYNFYNTRAITKSMIAWWAFEQPGQALLDLDTTFDIEHIYARSRQEKEHGLTDKRSMESLGNKSLLEKRINIRATDYRFSDKCPYYLGKIMSRGKLKEATKISELLLLASNTDDFTEQDISDRNIKILNTFVDYLRKNDLLK